MFKKWRTAYVEWRLGKHIEFFVREKINLNDWSLGGPLIAHDSNLSPQEISKRAVKAYQRGEYLYKIYPDTAKYPLKALEREVRYRKRSIKRRSEHDNFGKKITAKYDVAHMDNTTLEPATDDALFEKLEKTARSQLMTSEIEGES